MAKLILWILTFSWAALTYRLTTTPNLVVAPETWLNTLVMNGSHFGFFGVQAALLYFAIKSPKTNILQIFVPIITTSTFGYLIELVQRTIPGRTYDLVDWALDTLGAMFFVFIINKYGQTFRKWLHL